jgi:hypothetical protein
MLGPSPANNENTMNTPSPLTGEGGGEGGQYLDSPHPYLPPQGGKELKV